MFSKVKIHPSAEISPSARIGESTVVWNQVQIRENTIIGEKCVFGKDVYIDQGVQIGDRCKIQNGVSVYQGVFIAEDVFLGPHMTFTNDLIPRSFNENWTITQTHVKKGVSIGANATIVCGITIGEYAMVGAGAVVTRDIKPYELVVGNPAIHLGWVCRCGHKLPESLICTTCGEKYHSDVEGILPVKENEKD